METVLPATSPKRVLARTVVRRIRNARFVGSTPYWQRRYERGGNSGAGSYGQSAAYKAEFLNDLVADQSITSVIEFGCGDGAQLAMATYPRYTGLDVAPGAIELCEKRFESDETKSFLLYDPAHWHNHGAVQAELGLSLDVVQHLVEDDLLARHLHHVFEASTRWVAVYTPDRNKRARAAHVRWRTLDELVRFMPSGWEFVGKTENPTKNEESMADFVTVRRV
jgi:SAM-dependent methyltransferase